jgi:methionyl-tRNA formyltransferase
VGSTPTRSTEKRSVLVCGPFYVKISPMIPRIVFMGSPEFAVPTLRALAGKYPIAGVVTQPDRPAGRGRNLVSPPVKNLALELGLAIIQPEKLRLPEALQQLQSWAPDLIVVAAFGQILRPVVLDLPPHGCINVHASLLPRWRGAAPINAAILNGDAQTGVTIMQMDAGVDTGAIISQQAGPILPEDTTDSLGQRLAEIGAELLMDTLPGYLSGEIHPQPQENSQATFAQMLKKEDGLLDFNQPAEALARRVRAFTPWPGTYIIWQDQILKVHHTSIIQTSEAAKDQEPGMHVVVDGLPAVQTKHGILILDEVQPAGKKAMPGKIFLQGARNWV